MRCRHPPNLNKLFDYQIEGVKRLRESNVLLLADEPGLGKTLQTLRALSPRSRTIVLAPASLLLVWRSECEKWRPDLSVRVCHDLQIPKISEIVVISYDILPEPINGRLTLANLSEVTLILDEGHRVMNEETDRAFKVRHLVKQVERVWLLSGSPLPGKLCQLRGVLETMGLFPPLEDDEERFREFLKPIMVRRLRENVLDLPPKIRKFVRVPVSDPMGEELDRAALLLEEYRNELPPFEILSELRAALAADKIPHMLDWVERLEKKGPLVVFSAHVEPIRALEGREGWETLTGETPERRRKSLVDAFQNGEVRGLGCSIQVGGLGFTITRASQAIFVSLSYTPSENEQAEDRLVRIGQKAKSVLFYTLVADHPVDDRLLEICSQKSDLIERVIGKTS